MPHWIPSPIWAGQDAIIVGGGPSLSHFDFSQLEGRNTIAVNDAFKLGSRIAKWCIFGDASWFEKNLKQLEASQIPAVSLAPAIEHLNLPWLHHLRRERVGLYKDGRCGWNFNTGAAAVNLALYFGATRIFLLGFDMGNANNGQVHWHSYNDVKVLEYSYRRFLTGFRAIDSELPVKFPKVHIFNVTDGSSRLPFFQKINFETFAKYIPPQERTVCAPCQQRAAAAAERLAAA